MRAPTTAPEFDAERVRAIALELAALDGPLLPILHAIVDRLGHVDERAVPVVADVLNLTRAEVEQGIDDLDRFLVIITPGTAVRRAGGRAGDRHASRRV